MKEQIKDVLSKRGNLSFVEVAKILGYDSQSNKNVRVAYWRAKYELLEEFTGHSLEEYVAPVEEPVEEKEEEIGMPQMWRDSGNKLYAKGTQSNTWRVYYTDQDYEEIDEKEVEERYARNDENWYDFKYQDFYYRYDNGEYTRKKEGYLFYEPIDRSKYLSAKVMRSM